MPNRTGIEWTDFTSNPLRYRDAEGNTVWACEKLSAGCANCYAAALAERYGRGGPFNAGVMATLTPFLDERELRALLTSKAISGKRVFIGDMTDIFGSWVPDALLDQLYAVFALRPDVTFQVLTKRAERMHDYLRDPEALWERWLNQAMVAPLVRGAMTDEQGALAQEYAECYPGDPSPLPNVWLGVSVENQEAAEWRIPFLLDTPAAVRFLSCEPLLGPVSLDRVFGLQPGNVWDCLCAEIDPDDLPCIACEARRLLGEISGLHWVIAGCESGPGRRDMDLAWVVDLVHQCRAAGVAVFVKQLPAGGRVSHDPEDWPEALRVREFPTLHQV